MTERNLSKLEFHALAFLGFGDSLAVLFAWMGLALGQTWLIYVAVGLVLLRIPARVAVGLHRRHGDPIEAELGWPLMQFAAGASIYVAMQWEQLNSSLSTLDMNEDFQAAAQMFLPGGIHEGAISFGLWGILWSRTFTQVAFIIPGATYQVFRYELGLDDLNWRDSPNGSGDYPSSER